MKKPKATPKPPPKIYKKKERDPLAPKRPRTAFNFFLEAYREESKAKHTGKTSGSDRIKGGAKKWQLLTPEERKPYDDKAAAAREEYFKAKAEYEAGGGPRKFKLKMKGPPAPPQPTSSFWTPSERSARRTAQCPRT